MKKRILAALLAAGLVLAMAGCKNSEANESGGGENADASEQETDEEKPEQLEDVTVTVFAAKSLNSVIDELIGIYHESQPNVEIITSYDSSGTLMEQIEEGAPCDIFFSAAQKQMDQLEEEALVVQGTRANVVNNQVCLVTYPGSGTGVTGLANIGDAQSLALADGSVPVGKYTRQAMVNAGILDAAEDVSAITTRQVSEALNGIEINECANVGAVAAAVAEGANEVGTVYKSDTYGFEDELEILEIVSYELTGDVIYPIAQIVNDGADEIQNQAALDFIRFLTSDKAREVYEKYYFDTNVE